uniref:Enhancer of polycomb homolog n=1 Tax=Haplochromis burtoni TaxID=8153 RepID=A0A3Q2WVA9_HAPBU
MSKLSFRARALDASKPLPVFRCEDLPDLHEYASINRAVPQMPTGMEKEEESEHHLQRAISAQQVYGEKRDNMVIPVPEAECNITHYESLYPGEFKMPKQLIHIQPFSLDTEQPDYDLDSEDETFVNKLKKKMEITALQFEEMIDRLEKGSGQQLVSLQEAKLLLKEDDELIKEVFDYWSRKRKTSKGGCLIPSVKQEKRDGSSTSDPYVAFRRRTEKMQTRKNRKNDEASYEKMLKLRRDLSRAVTILEMIKRREKSKRELLHLTLEIVEKRLQYKHVFISFPSSQPEKTEAVRTKRKYEKKPKILPMSAPQHSGPPVFNPKDLNQYDFPSSDEEPFSQIHSGSSEAEEENDPDGCYAFRRKAGCQYYAYRPDESGSWPWVSPSDGGLGDPRFRYCLTSLNIPRRCIGLSRRRVARGGRILLDRAHTDVDNICQSLDSDPEPEPLASPLPSSPLHISNASTSETNTSDPASSFHLPPSSSPLSSLKPKDLSQILLNIKSCRWRHFRPRTLSHHPLGGDLSRRGFRDFSWTVSGLNRTLSGGASAQNRIGPATTPVNGVKHLAQTHVFFFLHVSGFQALISKTLDQASAQFAASALVTTDQLLACKSKEDPVPVVTSGVNGILPGAGVFKGLHLSSTTAAHHQTNQTTHTTTTAAPTFLQPSSNSATPSPANAVPTSLNSNPGAHAVLLGNNICLGVSSAASLAARHIPRTLGNVPSSALKLTAGINVFLCLHRENHDEEKPALNNIADNTVAMEVT